MKPDPLHPETIVRRAREIPFSRLDDESLAIDSQAGFCYSLNETGAVVWDLLAEPVKVADLCARLRQEFNVDEARCLADVTELLQSLREAGLVEASHGASG